MSLAAVAPVETRRVVVKAHAYQLQALRSDKPVIFVGAGVGSGKTALGSLWTLLRCQQAPPGVIGIIAANTYTQLFDATLRRLYEQLGEFGVPRRPVDLPKAHGPITVQIWNGSRWVDLLCRSLERYENLAGPEVGFAWMDELWQTEEEAFNIVIARARDKRMPQNQTLLTTTLTDPSSWLYERFVSRRQDENTEYLNAPTYVNAGNLGDGYIDRVLRPMYSEKMFQRQVEAKWVSLEGSNIYYAFDRAMHVSEEAEFDPALPILWSHDFNIGNDKPMSSCLCQLKKGSGPPDKDGRATTRPELHVFDEIILDSSDTNDAIIEFQERDWFARAKAGVVIYGDSSGKARDTRSKKTDYEILRLAGFDNQRVPTQNPPIRERHNAVNAALKNAAGDVRVKVHPRCQTLIKGFETVQLQKGASYLEQETRAQHVTTAVGYLIVKELPIRMFTGGSGYLR